MCEDDCKRGLYGPGLWIPFSLYLCLTLIVFVVQLVAFDNGVSSFISLSECQKTSPYYKSLPLYATVSGINATTNASSSDASFYFEDWHVVPTLGLCPSYNPPKDPSPSLSASSKASITNRRLGGAGGGGGGGGKSGGGGGGGGGSGSKSGSGNGGQGSNNGGSSPPATNTDSRGKGVGNNFQYKGCISFGIDKSGNADAAGPSLWSQLDALAAVAGYNGVAATVKTSFKQGVEDMHDTAPIFGLINGVNSSLWSLSVVLSFSFMMCLCKTCHFRNSFNFLRLILYIDFANHVVTFFFALILLFELPGADRHFAGTDGLKGLAKTAFPTCVLTVTPGKLLGLYTFVLILSGILAVGFIVFEVYFRCIRRSKSYFHYPPGTIICNSGHAMERRTQDPYKVLPDGHNKYAFCDSCHIENVFTRDGVVYHCPLCRQVSRPCDYCPPCARQRLESGGNGQLGVSAGAYAAEHGQHQFQQQQQYQYQYQHQPQPQQQWQPSPGSIQLVNTIPVPAQGYVTGYSQVPQSLEGHAPSPAEIHAQDPGGGGFVSLQCVACHRRTQLPGSLADQLSTQAFKCADVQLRCLETNFPPQLKPQPQIYMQPQQQQYPAAYVIPQQQVYPTDDGIQIAQTLTVQGYATDFQHPNASAPSLHGQGQGPVSLHCLTCMREVRLPFVMAAQHDTRNFRCNDAGLSCRVQRKAAGCVAF